MNIGSGVTLPNPVIVESTALSTTIAGTGSISGTATLTKKGDGLLKLQNPNTFTGATTIVGGTVRMDVPNASTALATGTTVTLGSADTGPTQDTVLQIAACTATSGTVTCASPITVSNSAPVTSKAVLDNNPATTIVPAVSGLITLASSRPLWIRNSGLQLWQLNSKVTGTGDLYFDTGSFARRARLTATTSDFVGNIYLVSGGVQVFTGSGGTNNCVPDTANIIFTAGSILGMGTSDTVGALSGTGTVQANLSTSTNTATLTVGANNQDGVFNGTILSLLGSTGGGGIAITKTGTGTQTLNASSTYAGGTIITGGTIAVGHDSALGSGAVNLNSVTGAIRAADTNARTIANAITYSTNFTLGSATTGDLLFTGAVNVGGGNKEFNVLNARTEFSGIMSGTLTPVRTKKGPGTLVFSGANTYPGSTVVSEGTLELKGGSQASSISVSTGASLGFVLGSPTSSSSTFDLTAGTIKITGTPTLASYTLISSSTGITGTPVLDAPIAGYALKVVGNTLVLEQAGYSSWASLNGATADRSADHDNDGVANGIEFFMGGTSGNTTGFTALPPIVKELDGSYSVTWTKAATYGGVYGTDYVVETSATLNGDWATEVSPGTVVITSNNVKFTFPGGPAYSSKNYVRLKVTGP